MAVNMKRTIIPNADYDDSEDDEFDEVFKTSPIRHPSPQPRKMSAKTKMPFKSWMMGSNTKTHKMKKIIQRKHLIVLLVLALVLDSLIIYGYFHENAIVFVPWILGISILAVFIAGHLIKKDCIQNGCCSNEIKVSRVILNTHNNDEYIDIDY